MELLTKTRDELLDYAKKLNIEHPKNITEDNLRRLVETEAIRQSVELEEKVRLRLQAESKMKIDLAGIRAEAELRGVTIEIPAEPTIQDVIRLQKQLNMLIKEPKPSPETIAIEKSKKVYAMFNNLEQKDMDVNFCPGGKYFFHLWPKKVHVLPFWLIGWLNKTATYPVYGKKTVPNPQAVKMGGTIEVSGKIEEERRFLFEVLGDAPDDASFGVVLDETTLNKLQQPV